ncbi:MAG: hypothetical protein IT521_05510 [Burkholderiales bacterium]|nr:hypothetical protein [Burkholderiales bacterium]
MPGAEDVLGCGSATPGQGLAASTCQRYHVRWPPCRCADKGALSMMETSMNALQIGMAAALMSLGAIGAASAMPCYVILDRNDVVIFRDTVAPFDLSDPKSPEAEALRQRGSHLLIADFDKCDSVGFISPTTGKTTASVEDIVSQLKPAIAPSTRSPGGIVAPAQ